MHSIVFLCTCAIHTFLLFTIVGSHTKNINYLLYDKFSRQSSAVHTFQKWGHIISVNYSHLITLWCNWITWWYTFYFNDLVIYLDVLVVYFNDLVIYLNKLVVYSNDLVMYFNDLVVYFNDLVMNFNDLVMYFNARVIFF